MTILTTLLLAATMTPGVEVHSRFVQLDGRQFVIVYDVDMSRVVTNMQAKCGGGALREPVPGRYRSRVAVFEDGRQIAPAVAGSWMRQPMACLEDDPAQVVRRALGR